MQMRVARYFIETHVDVCACELGDGCLVSIKAEQQSIRMSWVPLDECVQFSVLCGVKALLF